MSYVQSVIKPNETVLAVGYMHWIVYVRGTGSGIEGLHFIARPLELRSAIVVHEK